MTLRSGEKKATEGREEERERWSARQRVEVVLRLLRGEDLGELSREIKVSPPVLAEGIGAEDIAVRNLRGWGVGHIVDHHERCGFSDSEVLLALAPDQA